MEQKAATWNEINPRKEAAWAPQGSFPSLDYFSRQAKRSFYKATPEQPQLNQVGCAATKVTTQGEHSSSPTRAGKETSGVDLLSWDEHKEPAESKTRDSQNARDLYRIYIDRQIQIYALYQ